MGNISFKGHVLSHGRRAPGWTWNIIFQIMFIFILMSMTGCAAGGPAIAPGDVAALQEPTTWTIIKDAAYGKPFTEVWRMGQSNLFLFVKKGLMQGSGWVCVDASNVFPCNGNYAQGVNFQNFFKYLAAAGWSKLTSSEIVHMPSTIWDAIRSGKWTTQPLFFIIPLTPSGEPMFVPEGILPLAGTLE